MTDLAIRLRRAAFNRALADADLAAIGPILAPDCVMVTGSDSAVIAGRKAQLHAWKREFAARPRTIYTRTPETIVASPIEPIALETGNALRTQARGEATMTADIFRYFGGLASELKGETVPLGSVASFRTVETPQGIERQ
ncbi:MAG: hypothetical protein RIS94_3617, partial [Pseudomonadota bacterium]